MTDAERLTYTDEPEMLALIRAIHSHEFQITTMTGTNKGAPERTEEQWLERAAELIEEYTERLRRDDIRELLRRVDSGEVELAVTGEAVE